MSLQQLFAAPALDPRRVTFRAGEHVYEPQDAATSIYYIRSGEVRLFQVSDEGQDRLIEILGPGDWFNAAAFSSAQFCGNRAVATMPSVIVRAAADLLLAELSHNHAAAGELLKQMSDHLQKARQDAAQLVFDDCNTRLIQMLLQLSQTVAATPFEDGVELRITHSQLAQAIGAARETVSLALTDLRKQNLLRTGRNKLFYDPKVLRDLREVCKGQSPLQS